MREIILLNGRLVRYKWFQIHSTNDAAYPPGLGLLKANWYSSFEWQDMRGRYHQVNIADIAIDLTVNKRKSGRWLIEIYTRDEY